MFIESRKKKMKNNIIKKMVLSISVLSLVVNPVVVYAAPEKPNGMPGSASSNSSISYTGATTITSSTTKDDATITSTTSAQNALLISGGTSTLTNPTITKSGDTSDENSDFYGTNAAVLVYNGATLDITGGTITTNGGHANGVFAYGTGTINITGTTIKTSGNNSGGIMVTGGGTLNAKNLTVETSGNSSASIRSDRGGGPLTAEGGTYKTSGVGSPAIYSTADITVTNATLESTASEGVVVEGANKVTVNKTTLTDTNTTLNGQSETYKNIFLYQSQSGDAAEGTSYFTATDSTITTNKGDTIYVTNTTAVINLTNNSITNTSGYFLRSESAAWGSSNSNGGKVTLNLSNQHVTGDIVIDNISTLTMTLDDVSTYQGAINTDNQAQKITLKLSSDSKIILTDDSYIDSLDNETEDNSNIYLNGYNLYVDGEKIEANSEDIDTSNEVEETTVTAGKENANTKYYVLGGIAVTLVILIILVAKKMRK